MQPILDHTHPTIAALISHQGTTSDDKFAKRFLSISGTTWYRIKKGEYIRKDYTDLIDKLNEALLAIEDHATLTENQRETSVIPLSNVRIALAAVKKTFDQPRDRLAVLLTPTGGGKTSMARAILAQYPGLAVIVDATEPWRTSYVAAIHAIGDAIGLTGLASSSRVAERALLAELKRKPRYIIIDEGNYFGQASLNLIKAILNSTQCSVTILALPELWNAMKRRAWVEAGQLRTRTIAHAAMTQITARDVEALLEHRIGTTALATLNGQRQAAIQLITAAANSFGLYDTVVQIADAILAEANGAALTIDIITTAKTNVQTLRP